MEVSEWKVELMPCNRKAFKDKPLAELLSDVNYLTETDLSLMAACDSLAGTCGNLMRIHGSQSTLTSTHGVQRYPGSRSNSDVPKDSPRECGEGESSDEVVMEAPDMTHKYQEQWDITGKPSHSSHLLGGKFSNFTRAVDSELPITKSIEKMTLVQGKKKKEKASVHMGPSKTKHRNHTRTVPVSLSSRNNLPTKQKPTQVVSCMASKPTVEEGRGLVRRIDASSELTSKLNDSMDILRHQLDRIFDSSLNLANSHKTSTAMVDASVLCDLARDASVHCDLDCGLARDASVHCGLARDASVHCDLDRDASVHCGLARDASVHCGLDREPSRDHSSTLTFLNLSDQGYSSDGSTLDGTRAAHLGSDGELLSPPGSLYSAGGGTPLSPLSPYKGSFSYSPLSRLGSLHSSGGGVYPDGIVKNSMSPRSAFKKVVRFSQ